MADYASDDGKCGASALNGANICALPSGHDGAHRNAWNTAEWPRPKKCGHVGPFDGMTCERAVGHSGIHEHPRAGLKMVWSDVTDESMAKQLAALQRKVHAQANQINKLEELRRSAVDKQPEYQALKRDLASQAQLTEREHQFRVKAQQERDNDRERRAELIGNLLMDIRAALGEPPVASSATWADLRTQVGRLTDRERQFRIRAQRELDNTCDRLNMVNVKSSDRFRKLGAALGVDISDQTWDNLIHRVADLRKAAGSVWGTEKLTFSLPYTATTPLATRVDELAKKLDQLVPAFEKNHVRRCSAHHEGVRCVQPALHIGEHHTGPGTERWA